eukprot:TRINITY_DN12354_c0_g2_i4.p1 TRINITY_DN12354_c0_g2~~TRINITY_DN12354_c0_g2_i4.p1  ORF type:complete len:626 (+),score=124.04 TRINITY_DN12354_c0_g2_i4:185-2062(+)
MAVATLLLVASVCIGSGWPIPVPSDLAPTFKLDCLYNRTFAFDQDAPFDNATIFFRLDTTDPFTTYMWMQPDSLSRYLNDSPNETNYVILADDEALLQQLQINVNISSVTPSRLEQWHKQLFFCRTANLSSPVLDLLNAWTSPLTVIEVEQPYEQPRISLARFDCLYAWCTWPQDEQAFNVVYQPDPCQPSNSSHMWLVSPDTSACTIAEICTLAQAAGAPGIIIAAANDSSYLPLIGDQVAADANPGNLIVTVVSHTDGLVLRDSVTKTNATVVFNTDPVPGLMAGIDAQGRWFELGWEKYAYMMMLGWQAQYQIYLQQLHANLSKPAYIVPVFDRATMHGPTNAIITIPYPIAALTDYTTVELDMALSCPGNMDSDCATWDRTVHLYGCCHSDPSPSDDGCSVELGRWISPFRRRVGRWLTDISTLKPLLNDSYCTFHLTTDPWAQPWVVSLNLRYSKQTGDKAVATHPLFEGGVFNASYNDRHPVDIELVNKDANKVVLEAVITGHGSDNNGCGEFCPTSHHFVINGDEYMVNFTEAGTPFGCADKAIEGAEPNEHGTWYYGRNGWCDGMNVRPWQVDVTASATKKHPVTVSYYGWYHDATPQPTASPGIIIMQSHLVEVVT